MERIHSEISPILVRSDVPVLTMTKGQVLLEKSTDDFDTPTGFPGLHQLT